MPTPADIPIAVAIAVVQEGGWFLVGVRPPGVSFAAVRFMLAALAESRDRLFGGSPPWNWPIWSFPLPIVP